MGDLIIAYTILTELLTLCLDSCENSFMLVRSAFIIIALVLIVRWLSLKNKSFCDTLDKSLKLFLVFHMHIRI